jgi:hypothetical protein
MESEGRVEFPWVNARFLTNLNTYILQLIIPIKTDFDININVVKRIVDYRGEWRGEAK